MSGFADFDTDHRDLVTVTKFNFYGNRIMTASSDHRMKVWDQKDGEWQLIDTWRAHDAEIRDVSKQPLEDRGSRILDRSHVKTHNIGNLEWSIYGSAYWQRG